MPRRNIQEELCGWFGLFSFACVVSFIYHHRKLHSSLSLISIARSATAQSKSLPSCTFQFISSFFAPPLPLPWVGCGQAPALGPGQVALRAGGGRPVIELAGALLYDCLGVCWLHSAPRPSVETHPDESLGLLLLLPTSWVLRRWNSPRLVCANMHATCCCCCRRRTRC